MLRYSRTPRFVFYLTSSLTLLASAAAARPKHKETPVPEAVAVPDGHTLKLALTGSGAQRYECSAVDGTYSWKFIAPEADLIDRHQHLAGHHSAGPTWQALDGSQVTATKRAQASVSKSSIPWLLLEAATHTGEGDFADITFIQRLETEGGLAPETRCSEANTGEHADVPYRALYRFYKAADCD